jgi:hypothetical protein
MMKKRLNKKLRPKSEAKVIGAENFRMSVREFTSLQRVLANVDIMEREDVLYAQLAHGMES